MVAPNSQTDDRIICLYEQWSEETWRAGFIKPGFRMVEQFRSWLHRREADSPARTDYETEMLAEFHRQEAA